MQVPPAGALTLGAASCTMKCVGRLAQRLERSVYTPSIENPKSCFCRRLGGNSLLSHPSHCSQVVPGIDFRIPGRPSNVVTLGLRRKLLIFRAAQYATMGRCGGLKCMRGTAVGLI
jgi:hypothetical protein